MKFIYDEEKAIGDKQLIDEETPEQNRRAKIYNVILATILSLLAIVASVLAWNCGEYILGKARPLIGYDRVVMMMGVCLVVGIFVALYIFKKDVVMTAEERYPVNVGFLLATKNKKVLNANIVLCNEFLLIGNNYELTLTLEDENHIVTTKKLQLIYFNPQTRTDISETTVDLDNKIICEPFNH